MGVFSKQTLNRATNWFFAGVLALSSMATLTPALFTRTAEAASDGFESYSLGTVNGQDGWVVGPGSGQAYDQAVVDPTTFGVSGLGSRSLRVSSAHADGNMSQIVTPSISGEAGESTAVSGGLSSGPRSNYFEASWSVVSADTNYQEGLQITVSPDRGDGSRYSWIQMADTPTGLAVNFNDYSGGSFHQITVASGLNRSVVHTLKVTMHLKDGPANDVVNIYVDGALVHTGTTWEDYFRDWDGGTPRTVDSLNFRAGASAPTYQLNIPALLGKGFLIDNISTSLSNIPLDAPTNLAISKNGTNVLSGTVVNQAFVNGNIVLNFDAVSGAYRYITEVTYPGGSTQVWNSYNNTWLVKNGLISQGEFSAHGDGTYTYRVKTRTAAGIESAWSTPVSLVYDSTAPSLTSITANGIPVSLDGSTKVSAVGGITYVVQASDPSGFGWTYVEMNKNLIWKAANNGTSTTTLATVAGLYVDGQEYGLKICPHDKLGNGTCTQVYFTIDNTAPTATINGVAPAAVYNASTAGAYNMSGNLRVHVVGDDYLQTDLYRGSNPVPFKTYNEAAGKYFGLFWLTDGEYRMVVRDKAGNHTEYQFLIDRVSPDLYMQLSIDGKILSGDVHARSRVNNVNTGDAPVLRQTYIDGALFKTTNSDSRNDEIKFNTSAYSDGLHTLRVVATDVAGNSSEVNETFTVDNTKPTVKVNLNRASYVSSGATVGPEQNPEIEARDKNFDVVKVFKNGVAVNNGWSYNGHEFRYAKIGWLAEGTYVIRAYDKAGNVSDDFEITIDRTAPDVSIVTPDDEAILSGGPLQKWATTTPGDVDHYVYESYTDDSTSSTLIHTANYTGTQRSVGGIQNITFWWRIGAVDAVGNVSWTPLRKLTIDNKAPQVSIDNPAIDGQLFNVDVPVRVSANDDNLRHYWVKITRDGGEVLNTGTSAISSGVTDYLAYTATLDGEYVVTLSARDQAGGGISTGNRADDVVRTFTIDKTSPTVTVNPIDSIILGQSANVTGTVDEVSVASVEILVDGVVVGTASVTSGVFDFNLTGLTLGSHTVVVRATDAAGNTGESTESTVNVGEAGRGTNSGDQDGDDDGDDDNGGVQVVDNGEDVLGEQDSNSDDESDTEGDGSDVAGTSDENEEADNVSGNILGLDWYWWLVILAILGGGAWWLLASRKKDDE